MPNFTFKKKDGSFVVIEAKTEKVAKERAKKKYDTEELVYSGNDKAKKAKKDKQKKESKCGLYNAISKEWLNESGTTTTDIKEALLFDYAKEAEIALNESGDDFKSFSVRLA